MSTKKKTATVNTSESVPATPEEPTTAPSDEKKSKADEVLAFLGDKPEKEKPAQGKKKRVHYQERECPYCHKMVRNLGNHVSQKHGTEAPPRELTKEVVLGQKAPEAQLNMLESPVFYCQGCHAELRKGEEQCWKCGTVLNWEGLQ